ncbi:MAG: putative sensor domain DACNV-containing protein [Acidobacteriaceae bacterium]
MQSLSVIEELARYTFEQLTQHFNGNQFARRQGISRPPSVPILRDVLSALFFASLKTEESCPIQVRVHYMNSTDSALSRKGPIDYGRFFKLDKEIPLTISNLAKFSKAADPWVTGIAIQSKVGEGLQIWGILDQVVHFSTGLVWENTDSGYIQPGAFHAVINGPADVTVMVGEFFVARLIHDVLVTRENRCLSKGPINRMIKRWVEPIFEAAMTEADKKLRGWDRSRWRALTEEAWIRTVSRVLISIARQRHGGAILITDDRGCQDLLIKYSLEYSRLADGIEASIACGMKSREFKDQILGFEHDERGGESPQITPLLSDAFRQAYQLSELEEQADAMLTGAIKSVSSFAGVDGLVALSPNLHVRGFGAIIPTQQSQTEIIVSHTETTASNKRVRADRFGTRHRSMIAFCSKHPGSLGLVVSQDGDIRAMTSLSGNCVMFENVRVYAHYGFRG